MNDGGRAHARQFRQNAREIMRLGQHTTPRVTGIFAQKGLKPLILWGKRRFRGVFAEPVTSAGDRHVRRPRAFEGRDVGLMGQRDPDVVEPFEQAPTGVVVDVERVLDRVLALTRPNGS